MPTARETATQAATKAAPLLAKVEPKERRRRALETARLLAEWRADPDETDQVETMDVLRRALGPDRVASSRSQFP